MEKGKNLDLKQALELAADVQPIEVHASTIEDVWTKFLLMLYFEFNVFIQLPLYVPMSCWHPNDQLSNINLLSKNVS